MFVRKIQHEGEPCYAKVDYVKRIIRVEKGISGALLIASLAHEILHAAAPNVLDCEFIDKAAVALGDVLMLPEVREKI